MASLISSALNLVGFEDGKWYKIRNVGDNNVIQLDQASNKLICALENVEKLDLQLFRAIVQPNGTYRVLAKLQKSDEVSQVWDYLPHRGLLMQKRQSATDKFNQNWKSEAVPGYNSLYLIQSGPSPEAQMCLKNMGVGEQIKLIAKGAEAVGDNFTHWYLEIQEVSTMTTATTTTTIKTTTTTIVQSNVPQSNVPQSNVPQSNVPQSNVPQSNVPQTSVPQSNVPGKAKGKSCILG